GNFIYVCLKTRNMLQISYIRENREKVIEGLKKRGFSSLSLVDEIISLDEQRRAIQSQSDSLSSEANAAAKQIGEFMRAGKKEEAEKIKSEAGTYKERIKQLTDELAIFEENLHEALVQLPNLPHESVPIGLTAEENEIVFQYGDEIKFQEEVLPHW